MIYSRVGEQLVLELEDRQLPWGGRSPRSLTKCAMAFSLASEGTGRSIGRPIPSIQLELFPEEKSDGTLPFKLRS